MEVGAPPPPRPPTSPADLFLTFNRLALQGFGGVLAVAQRELVERKAWLTRAEFVELLALAQVLPGPNIVNLSLMLGDRFFGWRGAAAALSGMLLAPLVIVIALTVAYAEFARIAMVAGALRGMGAVAAGLILATSIKLAGTLASNRLGVPLCVALALTAFATVALLRWPLAWVVPALGGPAVAIAWQRFGRAGAG